jgi:hypothetical protein
MQTRQKQFFESHPLAISLALGVGFVVLIVLDWTWWISVLLAGFAFVLGLGLDRSES